jgi:hypothetical protein
MMSPATATPGLPAARLREFRAAQRLGPDPVGIVAGDDGAKPD